MLEKTCQVCHTQCNIKAERRGNGSGEGVRRREGLGHVSLRIHSIHKVHGKRNGEVHGAVSNIHCSAGAVCCACWACWGLAAAGRSSGPCGWPVGRAATGVKPTIEM